MLRKTEPINGDQMYNKFASFLDALVENEARKRNGPNPHAEEDQREGLDPTPWWDERVDDAAIDLRCKGLFAFDVSAMNRLITFQHSLLGPAGHMSVDAVPTFPDLPVTFCFPIGCVTISKQRDGADAVYQHVVDRLRDGYGDGVDVLSVLETAFYIHEPFPIVFFGRVVYVNRKDDGQDNLSVCTLIGEGYVVHRGTISEFSNLESPSYTNPYGKFSPDPAIAYNELMEKLQSAPAGSGFPAPLEEMCCIVAREHGMNLGLTVAVASAYLEQPTHYIVSEVPAHVADNPEKYARRSKAKIPRWDDRERWIILDPEAIRARWPQRETNGGSHASPVPHMRRGHTKVLRHERYKLMRGQVLRIRPTWVGARDWSHGRAKYKVISRVGAEADQA